jgi:hypothetical protein
MLFQVTYTPENFLFIRGNGANHDRFAGSKQAFILFVHQSMSYAGSYSRDGAREKK